jgi:hypothetical protein
MVCIESHDAWATNDTVSICEVQLYKLEVESFCSTFACKRLDFPAQWHIIDICRGSNTKIIIADLLMHIERGDLLLRLLFNLL